MRRWLAEHDFDVLHLHEPVAPSLSLLALAVAEGPIVATFHTATVRSRTLSTFGGVLQPLLEKVTARIAVSPVARLVQVEHLGGDAVEIPNGVDVPLFDGSPPLPGYPAIGSQVVGFVGRFDEPRKGMTVLLDAVRLLAGRRPGLRLLVVGRGDQAGLRRRAGVLLADRLDLLGAVDDRTKAAALRSMDVYCAPNLGRESFGMVLTEAMASGTPVLASDLDAFRLVLGAGRRGAGAAQRPGRAGRRAGRTARRSGPAGNVGRDRPAEGGAVRLAGGGRRGGQGVPSGDRCRSAPAGRRWAAYASRAAAAREVSAG